MRIVVDTNILISALGWKDGKEYQILMKCFQNELTLIVSPEILEEFSRVALRPKFKFTADEINEFKDKILETCEITIPETVINVITEDTEDNRILEAACSGNASFIISGNKRVLDVGEYQNIKILRSSEFLKFLKDKPENSQ
ncbi:MAG TPA: putative toxin-antitoxin system toxin component, PIN family [Candidatus Lokiarchaeia archaeon]|nr:putative toxin-antitoxin system toxin component, PIN family [Candidatus Lokiarchaeia archaeon]